MTDILNNKLPWDGSHLGSYSFAITSVWEHEGVRYNSVVLPDGWSEKISGGVIHCTTCRTNDTLSCIIEEIKPLFGISKRGIHRITISNREYLLYYVPISLKGELIWETPLNRLDAKHHLRTNPLFRMKVQDIIAFCDIMALTGTTESHICIRSSLENSFALINTNEKSNTIPKAEFYDYSIIPKTLFNKWFGEETQISDVVRSMIRCQHKQGTYEMNALISRLRAEIEDIIKKYDNSYIWYAAIIIDRTSRHLLV